MTFQQAQDKARQQGVTLERISRTDQGVRYRYELTDDETAVWFRYRTLADAANDLACWREKMEDIVFIV